jgi:hypothetical protein
MAQAVVRTKKRKRVRPAGGSESSSDEGFGEDDADWDVYKAMQGNDSGSGECGAPRQVGLSMMSAWVPVNHSGYLGAADTPDACRCCWEWCKSAPVA